MANWQTPAKVLPFEQLCLLCAYNLPHERHATAVQTAAAGLQFERGELVIQLADVHASGPGKVKP